MGEIFLLRVPLCIFNQWDGLLEMCSMIAMNVSVWFSRIYFNILVNAIDPQFLQFGKYWPQSNSVVVYDNQPQMLRGGNLH